MPITLEILKIGCNPENMLHNIGIDKMKKPPLSQDIQQLFNEYNVEGLDYYEVTQDERYHEIKRKWGGLSAVNQEVPLKKHSLNKENRQHSPDK